MMSSNPVPKGKFAGTAVHGVSVLNGSVDISDCEGLFYVIVFR